MPPRIQYTVSIPHPANHMVDVRMDISGLTGPVIDLVMPSWIPGSYRIRDYARHVQEFRALRCRKVAKDCWRVEVGRRRRVRVTYRVYAFELTVRSNHVDADHAYLNPVALCLYVDRRRDEPHALRLKVPPGWKVATALPKRGGVWLAKDYDELADSPIEMGRFDRRTFRVRGRPHELIVHGPGNYDLKGLIRDTKKIVNEAARIFRGLPYSRYVFLLHAADVGSGGLEHRASCSIQVDRFAFRPREKYRRVLGLVAHEFFHTWNVKRIVPAAFQPYDYRREVYTDLLWFSEGVTNYYALVLVTRAGLITAAEARETLARWITEYRRKPGRKVQSLAQSSLDAWIKLYQPDENTINSAVSYYEKGQLVGLLLDLELRRRSGGRVSLDDLMRRLYRRFGVKGKGIVGGDIRRAAEDLAGGSMERFFQDTVRGVRPLSFREALSTVGLRLEEEAGTRRAYLGIVSRPGKDRRRIESVLAESPAEKGGLNARDEIVGINGWQATPEAWEKVLDEARPGDVLELTVVRSGRLRQVKVRAGRNPAPPVKIVPDPRAPSRARREHRAWLGWRWASS